MLNIQSFGSKEATPPARLEIHTHHAEKLRFKTLNRQQGGIPQVRAQVLETAVAKENDDRASPALPLK